MTVVLGYIAVGFLALVLLMACADAVIRYQARRRDGLTRALAPAADMAISSYLADVGSLPAAEEEQDRVVLLQVTIEVLGDLQGSERDRLAGMLDQLGYVSDARSQLGSRRRTVRRRAAETLAVIGTPAAAAALGPGLADDDVFVRCTAARLLAEKGPDEAGAAVVAVAGQDVLLAPGAVAATVLALGRNRPAAIGKMLRPGIRPELKAIAIEVTGALRLAAYGQALADCLAERDDIAAAAATALGSIGETEAVPALMALASDDGRSAAARTAAASALGSIADPAAVPALSLLLGASDWSLRAAAARGLSELGTDGAAALRQAAASARPEVREPARAALQP